MKKSTVGKTATTIKEATTAFEANAAYLGIDVSKAHFDAALCLARDLQRQEPVCQRFTNDAKGIKALDKWLGSQGVTAELRPHLLIVMENTGIYHRRLWQYCSDKELHATIGNAADIKWSFGLVRGKDDVTDSVRLCEYAYRHADRLQQAPGFDQDVLLLKDLYTLRKRLLKDLKGHQVALSELQNINTKTIQAILQKASKAAIEGMKKSLREVDLQIKALIKGNDMMYKNYQLVLSVPGIGPITAVYLICCTANFLNMPTGKQLACYAGVAPFGHTSGSTIKGKPKVNKMANKQLKTLLHMGARSVILHNKEAKAYYERKLAEGKHDLCIVNAIKNKILLRTAAVIREGRRYVDKSKAAA